MLVSASATGGRPMPRMALVCRAEWALRLPFFLRPSGGVGCVASGSAASSGRGGAVGRACAGDLHPWALISRQANDR